MSMWEPEPVSPDEPKAEPKAFRYWPSLPQLGMLAFLASLTFFFGALIIAYVWILSGLPADSSQQRILIPAALWASTVILIASGITLAGARYAIRRGRIASYRRGVVITAILGLAFLASQAIACRDLFEQGVFVAANPRGNVFYTFTGFHALHLFGGLGALALLVRGSLGLVSDEESPLRRARNRAGIIAMYWNFVVVSWLVMFALLWWWVR